MPKRNGKVKIRAGYTKLNENICHELDMLFNRVDESLAKLANANAFSKLDDNSGFWLMPLSKD